MIPRSVAVLAVLHAAAALLFGTLAHLDSSNQFPDLVVNDDSLFAVGLYANRNIGVGLALLAMLFLASRWGLMALFGARFLTDAADLVMAFTNTDGAGALIGQLVFFGLLFASELYVLRTLFRLEQRDANPQEVPA
ncbi:MAG: hypothetical protein AAGA93_09495 [Actinomycetota bacterium]